MQISRLLSTDNNASVLESAYVRDGVTALVACLDPAELVASAPALLTWEIGAVSDAESVAQYMWRGGPTPPQASAPLKFRYSERLVEHEPEDKRPDKKYWNCVRDEMHVLLCTDDKKYRELRKRIIATGKDPKLVYVIAVGLSAVLGTIASGIAGFVALCLYAVVKLGTEAYCRYSSEAA